jgi:hypothetical protein
MSFKCPYCDVGNPLSPETYVSHELRFDELKTERGYKPEMIPVPIPLSGTRSYNASSYAKTKLHTGDRVMVNYYKCTNCGEYSIVLYDDTAPLQKVEIWVKPRSNAKVFPDYIPIQILTDYKEACLVRSLSPKASATLSRRCMQGMIRDYWGVCEKNLFAEIDAIKDKVDPRVWGAMDATRKIGNIGAHMENDVSLIIDIEPGEAEHLIRLIEYLLDSWYIKDHETDALFADILQVSADKSQQRHRLDKS